jgi:hypothetical protein
MLSVTRLIVVNDPTKSKFLTENQVSPEVGRVHHQCFITDCGPFVQLDRVGRGTDQRMR